MVQMKVTASVLIAAAAIAPALAYGFEAEDSLVTRDDNEFASAYGRGLELDLNEREFDEELYQREPFRGMGRNRFRGGNRHHHHGESAPSTPTSEGQNERREYNDDLFEREFDEELYQREPFRGKGMFRGARNGLRSGNRHHHHSESAPSTPSSETQNERREFDDDLLEREFDEELYQREPIRGMGRVRTFRSGSPHHLHHSRPPAVEAQNERREFDEELYQREPIRGMGRIRTSQSGNRHHLHHSRPPAVEAQNERREFDDELMEREYDSELFEREPEPLFGFIKKWFNKKKAPAPDAEAPEARDFDELD